MSRIGAPGLAYFLAVHLELFLSGLPSGTLPFFPGASVALAALLLGTLLNWPVLFVAGFLARTALPVQTAVFATAGDIGTALAGIWLIRALQKAQTVRPFEDLASWLIAALIAPAISTVCLLANFGLPANSPLLAQIAPFWLGQSLGILVIGPVIVSSGAPGSFSGRMIAGSLLLAGLAYGACRLIFGNPGGYALAFLVFPLLVLSAFLIGRTGPSWTTLFLCSLTIHFTASPATHGSPDAQIRLQTFLLALATGAQFLEALRRSPFRWLPYGILLAGWMLGGWIFWNLDYERQKVDSTRFENLIEQAQTEIRQRLQNYVQALSGGAALFAASENVSREEWRRYVESIAIAERFTGMAAMSVVFPVETRDEEAFLSRMRAEGQSDFQIHDIDDGVQAPVDPAGWKHFVVGFIAPETGNRSALGLDLATEKRRFLAARIARDFGKPRITRCLPLVQDGNRHSGFLLFVPMYFPDTPADTSHKRRKSFRGWVAAPIRTQEFFGAALRDLNRQIELDLYEGLAATPRNRIFRSSDLPPHPSARTTVLQLEGEEFTCRWSRGATFAPTGSSLLDAVMLALAPALLAGLVSSLQSAGSRANDLVTLRTAELRKAQLEAQSAREIAESASAAKTDFLAMMSHEIRTPINAVIGFTDLLAESPLPEEARSWTRTIQTSGQSLLSLINDILDFSKIEAGQLTLERIPLSPLRCAQEVVDLFQIQAVQKGLTVRIEADPSLPEAVLGDPVRMRQIVMNLVSNALKFTPSGSVVIALSYEPPAGLRVSVSDTGIGIPLEKQGRLFQRFSQVDSSTTRRYGGSGLGLAICKRLVEMMGGAIHVESMVNRGTTIWFHAPLSPTTPPAPAQVSRHAESARPGENRRVLVADDIPTNQKLARTMLGRLGCTVDIASSGREAIALAAEHAYDVIFMDCQMPDIDGYEATREIRRQETNRVKIFALTASVLDSDRRRCMESGMDGYLSKPFRGSDFAGVFRDLFCGA
jgi:signal transduction histidine kinase/integral membrane sensor domain MASE1